MAHWFENGQNILTLAAGTIAVLVQAATFWQGVRNANRIDTVHGLVQDTSAEVLIELTNAQTSLTHVTALLDRRKASSPPWPGGRRATDPPKLLTKP